MTLSGTLDAEASHPGPSAAAWRLFLAVFVVAVALANPVNAFSENRTIDLLRALAHGRLWIDPDAGNTNDIAQGEGPLAAAAVGLGTFTPTTLLQRHHLYSGGAPGLAFAIFPVYLVARGLADDGALRFVLVIAGAALPLAAGAVAVRRAAAALGAAPSRATGVALVHAFATIALPYGTRLLPQSLVIALLAWALALVLEGRHYVLAGLLGAFAVVSDYSAAPCSAAIGLLALGRVGPRGLGAYVGGAIAPAVLLGAYHRACFGSPFATPYDHSAAPLVRAYCAEGAYGFTYPRPWIVGELLFGLRHGFLWTQPAALVGLAGLVARARRSGTHALALGVAIVVVCLNGARVHDWQAGPAFGARYSVNALPFLALGLDRGLALLGRAAVPVAGASVAASLVGVTAEWRFSLPGNLELLAASGPQMRGVTGLIFGAAPWTIDLRASVGSALVFSLASGLAGALVLSTRPRAVAAAAAAPWLLSLPFMGLAFVKGPAGVDHARNACLERETLRDVAWSRDPDEARGCLALLDARFPDDIAARVVALDRILELDPQDGAARLERERLRRRPVSRR